MKRQNSTGNCPAKNPENSELSPWPKNKRLISFWWDKMMFPSVTFSLSVTSIHEHSLNFNLPDHHLILYSLIC